MNIKKQNEKKPNIILNLTSKYEIIEGDLFIIINLLKIKLFNLFKYF